VNTDGLAKGVGLKGVGLAKGVGAENGEGLELAGEVLARER
jgi:hypothetical protein